MKCRIELHRGAQKELEEAFQWYEERSTGLGVRFIEAVSEKINEISKFPNRYAKRSAEFREVSTNIFPLHTYLRIFTKGESCFYFLHFS